MAVVGRQLQGEKQLGEVYKGRGEWFASWSDGSSRKRKSVFRNWTGGNGFVVEQGGPHPCSQKYAQCPEGYKWQVCQKARPTQAALW